MVGFELNSMFYLLIWYGWAVGFEILLPKTLCRPEILLYIIKRFQYWITVILSTIYFKAMENCIDKTFIQNLRKTNTQIVPIFIDCDIVHNIDWTQCVFWCLRRCYNRRQWWWWCCCGWGVKGSRRSDWPAPEQTGQTMKYLGSSVIINIPPVC